MHNPRMAMAIDMRIVTWILFSPPRSHVTPGPLCIVSCKCLKYTHIPGKTHTKLACLADLAAGLLHPTLVFVFVFVLVLIACRLAVEYA